MCIHSTAQLVLSVVNVFANLHHLLSSIFTCMDGLDVHALVVVQPHAARRQMHMHRRSKASSGCPTLSGGRQKIGKSSSGYMCAAECTGYTVVTIAGSVVTIAGSVVTIAGYDIP